MNDGILQQGQPLTAVGLPNEGSFWRAGTMGCRAITVSQLRGPMGWYDVAAIEYDGDKLTTIHPLHLCDHIET
ncbi:MAG: hypothetical protein COA96_10190 [SAR86 cluster bacterium]|uniref:Uncharacterized protein n=1 Tax=SAR86 cluster bacterium TaxID=2030880 RepID=A0A2A5AY00_9GAMM|nr:MAG: hypothetical protein COA96_10190 [SAR86 cluster bacterium]